MWGGGGARQEKAFRCRYQHTERARIPAVLLSSTLLRLGANLIIDLTVFPATPDIQYCPADGLELITHLT